MNIKKIKKEIKKLKKVQEWNHSYDFGQGISTIELKNESIGSNLSKWERIKPILSKKIKKSSKVLDIGCSDGFFSIQTAKYAKHVTGIDWDKSRIEKAKFASKVLKIKNVKFVSQDLYYFLEKKIKFQMIIALGLIHRIPDIYGFCSAISKISDNVLFEFKTLDTGEAFCEYVGNKKSTKFYFAPSINFIIKIMQDFDFKKSEVLKDEKSNLNYKRTIILFSK